MSEKYLSIKLAGHDYVTAWKNKDKKGSQPDFKGDGVAVWIHEKKAPTHEVASEDLE
jgi:hypothetical protein